MSSTISITIGGQERDFNFGLKCISELVEHENWGFSGLGQKMQSNPLLTTPVIFFYGAKNACERKRESVDFYLIDVIDWLEEARLDNPEVIKVISFFSDSLLGYLKDLQGGDSPKEEVKKK